MRWIACIALFLVLTVSVRAAGPDDQYLDVYNQILQADTLKQDGQNAAAAEKYLEAQSSLQRLRDQSPNWNPDVVKFRAQYLADQLQALSKFLPAATAATPAAPVAPPPATEVTAPSAVSDQQIATLQQQVRDLSAANGELENKLKEALSVQPAAVSPAELAKRESEIVELKKDRDLLTVELEQAKATNASAVAAAAAGSDAKLKTDLAAAQSKADADEKALQETRREMDTLKAAAATPAVSPEVAQLTHERNQLKADLTVAQGKAESDEKALEENKREMDTLKATPATPGVSPEVAQLTQERDKLKAELDARTKDLADAEAHGDEATMAANAKVKDALAQRDELQKKLDAATAAARTPQPAASSTPPPTANNSEVEELQARLAVFDAKAVPYTPEELAILNQAPSRPPAQLPASPAVAAHPHVGHSSKDLPPGAGALMADAMRASMERNYPAAEAKYNEVLSQDENNVYVLTYLANAQFAAGNLDDCEKTVERAMALDPDDPPTLYMLGVLRYRQEKLDAALDALSRSAKFNPTNSGTENYLGCVLADKGQRTAAETAFRKALQLDPGYGDAHYNLAFVYATEKPPAPELARWHYKRALDLGHVTSPALEKLLDSEK